MVILVWVWLGLGLATVLFGTARNHLSPLLLAYFAGLSLLHVPGAVNYLGAAPGLIGHEETLVGFRATLLGLGASLAGALLAHFFCSRAVNVARQARYGTKANFVKIGWTLLVGGLIMYFLLLPIVSYIPSVTAIFSSVSTAQVVGFWCLLYDASQRRSITRTLGLLALLPVLPFLTLVTGGFAGFGIAWMIAVFSFTYAFSRHRFLFNLMLPFALLLGVSLFVAYFNERELIRTAVWQERASFGTRINRVLQIADRFEIYNLNDQRHVRAVDHRLNQNFLVGVGIIRHEGGAVDLLYGNSIPWWALVPRAIWPDKPSIGGGGDLVSQFTGIEFAAGTSIGAGQPLEFYVNFGWSGIVCGFLVLGFVLHYIDLSLVRSFHIGNVRGILNAGLPGLALLQPGGNLLEILVSVVGAILAARFTYVGLRALGVTISAPSLRMLPSRSLSR